MSAAPQRTTRTRAAVRGLPRALVIYAHATHTACTRPATRAPWLSCSGAGCPSTELTAPVRTPAPPARPPAA